MNPRLRTLKTKLIGVIVLTTAIIVVTGLLITLWLNIAQIRSDMAANFIVIARVTGNNLISELSFHDRDSAADTLQKLEFVPAIENAVLYDAQNTLLASYQRPDAENIVWPDARPSLPLGFSGGFLHVAHGISFRGKFYGTLYLRVSTAELRSRIRDYWWIIAGLALGLLVFSGMLALLVQRIISRPIIHLGDLARKISQEGDYSLRVDMRRDDEIGVLYDAFNNMLEQIHNRQSERDVVEMELVEARQFLTSVIESMPSMLVVIDRDGTVTHWNEAAARTTGVSFHDAIGGSLWRLVPFLARFRQQGEQVMATGRPAEFLKEEVVFGEEKYYFTLSLYPLVSKQLGGLVIRIDNVSELERKEMQLRQAQKMETVGTLAGGLAHDFNNVLGGIIGTISLLKYKMKRPGDTPPAEIESGLGVIEESANRAADMVQQLLTLSRRQEMTFTAVDLNTIIRNVVTICRNTLDKSIEIEASLYPDEAGVSADPTQLAQVLLNLCVNAAHAMTIMRAEGDRWGGRLSITIERIFADRHFCEFHPEARGVDYWNLRVADEGVGMDSRTTAKIFDPFFTTKSKGKGSGLGLAMVYNIVQQHKGFIDVYSEPGVGSTFCVYLPATRVSAGNGVSDRRDDSIFRGEGVILVIDDEPLVRRVAQEILETCGYTVLLAEDGFGGLELFHQRRGEIRLVLLDLVMPKMSGREVCLDILRVAPETRVVMASGFRRDERLDDLIAKGVRHFIQKPYTLEKLAAVVAETLRERSEE